LAFTFTHLRKDFGENLGKLTAHRRGALQTSVSANVCVAKKLGLVLCIPTWQEIRKRHSHYLTNGRRLRKIFMQASFSKYFFRLFKLLVVDKNRKPLVSTECQSLPEAEKFRRDIVREITRKIATIQNGTFIIVSTQYL
jgi:hypothetical protein